MNFISLIRSALLVLPVLLVLASVVHVSAFLLFSSVKPPEAMFLESGNGSQALRGGSPPLAGPATGAFETG